MKYRPAVGATPRARALGSRPTDAETRLWRLSRQNFPAARFRRQVPIRSFIVDFASHRARLVIEADGGQHGGAADAARTGLIESEGYCVLRFWNHELLGNPDEVAAAIAAALRGRHPSPNPSPSRGGE